MELLEAMINSYYSEKLKHDTRPMRKFHPSTIGMCQRRIVFDMLMVPYKPHESQLVRIFENGHSMHHRYEKLFKDMGILVQAEMKLENEDISGHTDALVKIQSFMNPFGEYYLIELKSAFSKSFEWMQKNNSPKAEHKAQLTFYLYLAQTMLNLDVRKGIIFVENKDTQEVWEHHLDYDPRFGEQLMEKARTLIQLAKERRLPEIPKGHTPSFYKCAQCNYNFYCHGDSRKNDGQVRYPIPFQFGSPIYQDVLTILHAIQNGLPIPDVIKGDTNGDLVREVTERNTTNHNMQRWMDLDVR
ncbi:CRISPR/Cas system-associated exonuclease Cas4, RecB family [Paenibacillus sp. UNC496MF]|uniref:CRISPR-associated protein Cas4 n=1 Tax=Paenibacillus sp. UNC496MF TaxID=1502753 RepID=UPI0008EF19FD|nr:PD-(D/E)XK nuclease family protein [Paenibacillus sp. UNC496MF]SFJ65057.1 CRISPR/Cas system-associated exonuclease Cas4, RecB family [Paenibacillus sp. UNC496MF]